MAASEFISRVACAIYSLALANLSLACLDQSTYALAVSGEGFSRTFLTGSGKLVAVDFPESEEVFPAVAGNLFGSSVRFSRTALHWLNQSTPQSKVLPQ